MGPRDKPEDDKRRAARPRMTRAQAVPRRWLIPAIRSRVIMLLLLPW